MGPLNLWQKTVIVALSLLALARASGARIAETTASGDARVVATTRR